jgi:hypothetical protein
MRFEAKSEEQIERENLMPEGTYDFEVLSAEDTVSKKGNDMIKVNLGLYQGEAMTWKVFDFLLPSMPAKLRHFCDTTGLLAKYEAGTLGAADCKGRAGKVKIIIKPAKDGYGPQNGVDDYVCRQAKPLTHDPKPPEAKAEADDDIPF